MAEQSNAQGKSPSWKAIFWSMNGDSGSNHPSETLVLPLKLLNESEIRHEDHIVIVTISQTSVL